MTSLWSSDPERMQVPLEFQHRVLTQPSCTARAFTCFIRCSSSLLSATKIMSCDCTAWIVHVPLQLLARPTRSWTPWPRGKSFSLLKKLLEAISAHGPYALRPKMQQSEKNLGAPLDLTRFACQCNKNSARPVGKCIPDYRDVFLGSPWPTHRQQQLATRARASDTRPHTAAREAPRSSTCAAPVA